MFGGLIDYAGLYPPASLDMDGAVGGYRKARASSEGWIVNRFLCPASRLEELAGTLVASMQAGEEPWRLSVTFDTGPAAGAGTAAAFHAEMAPAATVDLAEAPIPPRSDAGAIASLFTAASSINDTVVPYLEVPRDGAIRPTSPPSPPSSQMRCAPAAPSCVVVD